MIKTVPLRTGLGLTILLMGVFTIALVFLSAEIYRHHAIENQRSSNERAQVLKEEMFGILNAYQQLRDHVSRNIEIINGKKEHNKPIPFM